MRATANMKKKQKKRGKYRKRKQADPEQQEVSRLERNRKCARECRMRKKKYIKQLEEEVITNSRKIVNLTQVHRLKTELEGCKLKLDKYEKVEQYRSLHTLETYRLIKEGQSPALFKAIEEVCPALAQQNVVSEYCFESAERQQVIEYLAKTTVEILMPVTHKYLLWASENNSGSFNLSRDDGTTSKTDLGEVSESVKFTIEEVKVVREAKPFFLRAGSKFKTLLKQFMACKKEIQDEIKNLDEQVQMMLTKISQTSICAFMTWAEKVRCTHSNPYR